VALTKREDPWRQRLQNRQTPAMELGRNVVGAEAVWQNGSPCGATVAFLTRRATTVRKRMGGPVLCVVDKQGGIRRDMRHATGGRGGAGDRQWPSVVEARGCRPKQGIAPRGSGWNSAAWAGRGRVPAGPLPQARPGEQCHFQIIQKKSNWLDLIRSKDGLIMLQNFEIK
jgi:hypothetical protein